MRKLLTILTSRNLRRGIALLCVLSMIAACVACGEAPDRRKGDPGASATATPTGEPSEPSNPSKGKGSGGSTELTGGTSGGAVTTNPMDETMKRTYEAFAYKLFRELQSGQTRMISPFSVYTAFGMLGNGAAGETETQMNAALGLTPEARNAYLAAWIDALVNQPAGEAKFTNADSLWIREDRCKNVSQEFLKICGDYYRAGVFSAKMDPGTVSDINNWVDVNTKGMIKKLFDELSPETAMVLMNAISFEAEWSDPFLTEYIRENAEFTHENGTVSKVALMYGDADGRFLQNSLATGLVKSYKGGKFRYVALLPNEGVTIDQLIASLQPGSLDTLFAEAKSGDVHVAIPRYEEISGLLILLFRNISTIGILKALGMNDAFDPNLANFSKLFSTPTCISQVLHKTFISVDNKGTKAAAVTAIAVNDCAMADPVPSYNVILNRPFVYMILDENNLPIFLGTYE